jgi:chromosome segregation protein
VRLKKLDIVGFKSFPERTKVHLVDGVTAIVGPNGCGKTNILDALRWVMGEQRPTLLRGGKMEDVIFNGSQGMSAHGMAEVSLSVENTRGILPTEYNELLLTRRLFRSGESEYLLNRTPCRLKDIVDLFADTGMGANAYSVIQQHMIDALISDKAEERRVLFEEAAGITKYKQRKRAALRKLEATEADLQRLQDIVSEVKSQVNSLNRQMKKAERYQKTHLQLKELELSLAKVTLEALDAERKEKRLALEEWRDKLSSSETELTGLSAQLEAERQKQSESDRVLSEVSSQTQRKTEEAHIVDRRITVMRERVQSLKAQRERNQVEIEACEKRVEILEADEAQVKVELTQKEESLQSALGETTSAEQASEAADSATLAAKSGAVSDTDKLMALEGRISSGKTDTQNLSQQETELRERLAATTPQLTAIGDTISAERTEFEKSEAIVTEKNSTLAETSEKISQTNARVEELNQNLEDHTDQITDLSSSLEATQTRKVLLEETIARHEGFGAGASAALDVNERWPKLLGALAELVSPKDGYARALEAALDDVAGYLVAEDRATAAEVIA